MPEFAWLVESLRGTFFPAAAGKLIPRDWWVTVGGAANDDLVVNEGPVGHASAQGQLDDEHTNLVLNCQPARIDWLLTVSQHGEARKPLALGRDLNGPIGLEDFEARIRRWISKAPVCSRVALGCVLRHPVDAKRAGYEVLQRYLPAVKLDPEGSSDFNYRINRPRRVELLGKNLEFNRVSNWSVITAVANLPLEFANLGSPLPGIFARVDLDLSTTADAGELFEGELLIATFSQLKMLARELMEQGDIP